MTHFPILATGANVAPLVAALAERPHLWNQHTMRKDTPGTPHEGMSDIWLRYNDWRNYHGDHCAFADEHESVWYPAYRALPEVVPLVWDLMRAVRGERLGAVLITRVPPGATIRWHVDAGWHVGHYSKFYIQLESCPGADFLCGEERFCPAPGDVYQFDNRKPHAVVNAGTGDRTTLIVCIRTDQGGGL